MNAKSMTESEPRTATTKQIHPGVLLDRVQLLLARDTRNLEQAKSALGDLHATLQSYFAQKPYPDCETDPVNDVPQLNYQAEMLKSQQWYLLGTLRGILERVREMGQTPTDAWWRETKNRYDDFVEHFLEHEADEYALLREETGAVGFWGES